MDTVKKLKYEIDKTGQDSLMISFILLKLRTDSCLRFLKFGFFNSVSLNGKFIEVPYLPIPYSGFLHSRYLHSIRTRSEASMH